MSVSSSLRMRRRLRAIVSALLVAGAAPYAAQDPAPSPLQRPTFRLDANFVRVDIYPTVDGKPVTDLTVADFEILEDGVPQDIETFERIEIAGHTPVEQRRDPNNVADMRARAENPRARVFVIFLDTYHTEIFGSHAVQRPLVTMLDRMMGPDDLFAVMTPQMSPSDLAFARKTETIEGYLRRYWAWGQRDRWMPDDPVERQYLDCYPGTPMRWNPIAQEMIERRREKFALDALNDLSIYLRGVREERKAVIAVTIGWILPRENRALAGPGPRPQQAGVTPDGRLTSDRRKYDYGYSIDDCERDRQTLAYVDLYQAYLDMIDTANRSNVSIYPVDSRGLAATDTSIASSPSRLATAPIGAPVSPRFDPPAGPGDLLPANEIRLVRRRVEGLRTLATDTDGIAVIDTNDLDKGLQRIVADMSSYYLAGYYTKNAKLDGRFRKITVRVKRPGVEIRARRGYKAATAAELTPPMASRSADAPSGPPPPVLAALALLPPNRPRPLRTSVAYARSSRGVGPMRMWTAVELEPSSLKGEFANGGEVAVVAAGADGSVLAQGRATLPPGARSAVVELGVVAGAGTEIVVRTRVRPQGEGTALSDLATVGSASDASAAPLLWRRGPSTQMRYVATADARFSRADRVRADVALSDANATVTAALLDRIGATIAVPVSTANRAEGPLTWGSAELSLAPLAAGDYVLRITVSGPDGVSDVYTGIRVVP